jgi:hypothetical protein
MYRLDDNVTISAHTRRGFPLASTTVPISPKSICASCPTQRRVADRHALARQQLVHANQPQRRLTVEPRFDLSAATGKRPPRLRRWRHRPRLYLLPHRASDLVGHRDLGLEALRAGLLQIATDSLAIQSSLARDPPCALPCLSTA